MGSGNKTFVFLLIYDFFHHVLVSFASSSMLNILLNKYLWSKWLSLLIIYYTNTYIKAYMIIGTLPTLQNTILFSFLLNSSYFSTGSQRWLPLVVSNVCSVHIFDLSLLMIYCKNTYQTLNLFDSCHTIAATKDLFGLGNLIILFHWSSKVVVTTVSSFLYDVLMLFIYNRMFLQYKCRYQI